MLEVFHGQHPLPLQAARAAMAAFTTWWHIHPAVRLVGVATAATMVAGEFHYWLTVQWEEQERERSHGE